ncbi:MAG: nucleoside-diphosphate sugar epimerase/dehydratase [Thermoanaerobaculia bacterium]|nr:nucleoside-diphosphate sugar epimerase/dehydratase [Thermoanaerobaculia bacterium]
MQEDDSPSPPARARPGPVWARHLRREVQFLLDLGSLTAAFALAYLLRFDFRLPADFAGRALVQLPLVVLIQFVTVFLLGTYNFVWRYIGLAEVKTFLRGAVYSAAPLLLLRFGLPDSFEVWRIPVSVILMDTALAFGGLLSLRVLRRSLYERYERIRRTSESSGERRVRVLLAGAGRAGQLAAREVLGRGDLNLDPVGFVDDDAQKLGSVIQGLKVLGDMEAIPRLAAERRIDRVVITIAGVDADTVRRILDLSERAGVRVQIIPGLYEILQGRVSISRFRDVDIQDLLGREPVRLDEEVVRRFLTGKCALVTGAGGSIGSELARQVARYHPGRLLLVERAEGALFNIHRELAESWPQLAISPLVADVGDPHRMRRIFGTYRPDVVFHAAAHKHVPMMEENTAEAVRNNVLATATLSRIAGENGSAAFVLISTDKAVHPASVMGASKRLAELVIQEQDRRFERTRFLGVRFGNVLGSAGSVVPIFREQIRRGGPVTVTHPEARRYFMTVSEAAQLVLEAGAIGGGGEILILDMGEPVRILDLARDMISLSGYKPYEEISIVFTGLRPGEKLHEQLQLDEERVDRTRHPKIFVGKLRSLDPAELDRCLDRFSELVQAGAEMEIRRLLAEVIPEAEVAIDGEVGEDPALGSSPGLVH